MKVFAGTYQGTLLTLQGYPDNLYVVGTRHVSEVFISLLRILYEAWTSINRTFLLADTIRKSSALMSKIKIKSKKKNKVQASSIKYVESVKICLQLALIMDWSEFGIPKNGH
jgi:hypothetical protein